VTDLDGVEALLFDVFGTVVDWRTSVIDEGRQLGQRCGVVVDWAIFADRWRREGYLETIRAIVSGGRSWEPVDQIMRSHLSVLSAEMGFASVGADELDRFAGVWERLDPWPDVRKGLEKLRSRFILAPLSNSTAAGLVRMARRAGLTWDCVFSTEMFGAYKPDPSTYLGAARHLRLDPSQVALVAAHPEDLQAAARCGLRTVLVPRPLEWGRPAGDPGPEALAGFDLAAFDLVAQDFEALALYLGS
jgi:2-haloacid dehalogenase